jgi:hypothetical protein
MPIESGPLCPYCSDEDGHLIEFEECLERFSQWTRKNEPDLDKEQATTKTLEFMSSMPAWREHPEVLKRIGGNGSD